MAQSLTGRETPGSAGMRPRCHRPCPERTAAGTKGNAAPDRGEAPAAQHHSPAGGTTSLPAAPRPRQRHHVPAGGTTSHQTLPPASQWGREEERRGEERLCPPGRRRPRCHACLPAYRHSPDAAPCGAAPAGCTHTEP